MGCGSSTPVAPAGEAAGTTTATAAVAPPPPPPAAAENEEAVEEFGGGGAVGDDGGDSEDEDDSFPTDDSAMSFPRPSQKPRVSVIPIQKDETPESREEIAAKIASRMSLAALTGGKSAAAITNTD